MASVGLAAVANRFSRIAACIIGFGALAVPAIGRRIERFSVIQAMLGKLAAGHDLTADEMSTVMDEVMAGHCSEAEIGLLLTALHHKGETVAEIAGAALSLRRHAQPIRCRHDNLLDTCGTGGDASGTFNISTAAAIVTAAAGVPVAKHGNRGITSRTGSADALAALGVNIEASVAQVEACLNEVGLGFCFAPLLHPSMRNVASVRKQLGFPTIFNFLGPLTNPAGAHRQLLGVGRAELQERMAESLAALDIRRALVVRGDDGLDEVTLATSTLVYDVNDGRIQSYRWSPGDFGLAPSTLKDLVVTGPAESAAVIRSVLGGERGPARDIVVLNAAAALIAAGAADIPAQAAAIAERAVDSGAAGEKLAQLAAVSHRG